MYNFLSPLHGDGGGNLVVNCCMIFCGKVGCTVWKKALRRTNTKRHLKLLILSNNLESIHFNVVTYRGH
jgi:hypothetical protein